MLLLALRRQAVVCLAHVTNQLGCVEGDFDKGEANGARRSLDLVLALAEAWRQRKGARESRLKSS